MHLLIPFASTLSSGCRAALATLQLPNLSRLLALLAPGSADLSGAQSLSAPHERVIARACGLPLQDGLIPFAAQDARSGWAFVTPCHWQMGQDHVRMLDPASLQLSAEHAQFLREAMQPYFVEDGIELLDPCLPGTMGQPAALSWLAQGELFRDMASASLDRVSGRELSDWMPQGAGARVVRRLQSEMQMLLYTHPVNDERQRHGQLPVNSFWVSGCGAWGPTPIPAFPQGGKESRADAGLVIDTSLRQPALSDDASAYALAWHRLDAGPLARMLQGAGRDEPISLSLCGERACVTWSNAAPGVSAALRKLLRRLRRPSVWQALEPL